MKGLAIFLFLIISSIASATSYYISPSGNDTNTGTIDSPFFTLNKAWSVVRAGDVIYARGGTYRYNSRQNLTGKNGSSSGRISIWAYPGERPVFTKSTSFVTPGFPVSLIYIKADYVHLKGIEVAYFTQASTAVWYAIAVQGSDHCIFEQINSHHNGNGMGIRDECSDNLVLNSDFHHNNDPMTSYGNADGLSIAYHSSSAENTVRGCRLWNNSDDGLDLWDNNGNVLVENSWSWKNGYKPDGSPAADGCGFKFGKTTTENGSSFKRTIRNTISVYNRSRGYMQNAANVRHNFYNNIAWKNPKGIEFPTNNLAHVFRNNIVFDNTQNWEGDYSNSVRDHNSNDPSPIASTSDFISTDTTGISGKRKPDGTLPDINFMKLASGSDLVDAGINVGLAYVGKAPDLGAYESGTVTTPVAVLTYQNSNVKDSNPSEVEVVYCAIIKSGIQTPASAFEIRVNNVLRAISSIRIVDRMVYITLDTPVKSGDIITVSYNKPSLNPLQCQGGTYAETITNKAVSNSVEAVAENPQPTPEPAPSPSPTGSLALSPFPVKDHISIMNYTPGDEAELFRITDLKGKLCFELKLEKTTALTDIPVKLAPGFYVAQIIKGTEIQHRQKLVFVK